MLLYTKNFGEIEINDSDILFFPDGIPAFENQHKFILIQNPDEDVPFHWLQSVEDTDLAFVVVDPFLFRRDYDFEIPQSIVDKLEIKSPEEVSIFAIVVVPQDITKMTANLKAPIVVNIRNRKAKQVPLDDDNYRTKHYILEEMKSHAICTKEENQRGTAAGEGR